MPVFPQDIEDNLRELARRIDAINTARPGPTSWGPGDGEASAVADDGRILFSFGNTGASVESRGALTGLTPLLDGIRSKNDDQDGRLDGHDGDVSRIDAKNDAQDGTLSAHDGRITTAQARADKGVADAATAQGRADDAWSRAGTALSNAAAAQSRADAAHALGSAAATRTDFDALVGTVNALSAKVNALEAWLATNTPYPQTTHPDMPYFMRNGQFPGA